MAKYIFVYRNSFSGECKVFEGTLSHFWQFIIDLAKKIMHLTIVNNLLTFIGRILVQFTQMELSISVVIVV